MEITYKIKKIEKIELIKSKTILNYISLMVKFACFIPVSENSLLIEFFNRFS